ncbi:MFS transporter [Brevibacillus fluminis]|uniref:MFS transporter n=1 Tax=Brevibacillus fluminis TaxID=511487 RepID=A0A3M8DH78_9BACL|nr:MFS transporter [Brevibacillus fluminis]RNB87460.1 MFS transporter [Brevibacillus fluminis]
MTSQQTKLVFSLCFAVLFAVMSGTMFNVALPQIAKDYSLLPTEVSWVVVGYGVIFAIGSVTYGKLADLFPVRRLIVVGLSIFCLGSVCGFFASHYGFVIAARLIQASGAAAVPALSMIVATKYFPSEKRGHVLGYVSSTVALGMGVGPILSGLVTQFLGWSYLFLVPVISILALPLLQKTLPSEKPTSGGSFDALGAVLLASGIASLLLGLNVSGWFFLSGVIILALFVLQIRRSPSPFVQVRLLANKPYRLLLFIGMLLYFCLSSSLFLLPLLLKDANGLQAGSIGLVLFPGAILTAILGSHFGKLSDRFGSPAIMRGAVLVMSLAFAVLSTIIGFSPVWIGVFIALINLSFSAIQSSLGSYVSRPLDRSEMGVGMGLFNLSTFLGNAIGPALASRFLEMETAQWNVLTTSPFHSFSNAFLLLVVVALSSLLVLAIVQLHMRGGKKASHQQKETLPT